MDQSEQTQTQHQQLSQQSLQVAGVNPGPGQIGYPNPPDQSSPIAASDSLPSPTQSAAAFSSSQQLAFQQAQHFHQQQQQLQTFWTHQMQEIEQTIDFKNHTLPLARIKKIMKADEDVRMISAEAPVVFAKACEMFILELTLRSWIHTEENKRRTLQKNDIAAAISRTDIFDFLVDIIPGDELREEGLGITKATIPVLGSPADPIPYYYTQPPPFVGPPGMIMGKSLDPTAVYAGQQPRPPMAFMPWPHTQPQEQHTQQQQNNT